MKYLFSFLLTLLVGYGQGQTKPVKQNLGDLWTGRQGQPMHAQTIDLDCDSFIDWKPWGKSPTPYPTHPKQIKDIFPSECGKKDGTTTYVGSAATWETDSHYPAPEPPDVPAIQGKGCELTGQQIKQGYCCSTGGWQMDCPHHVDGKPYCADKSRILLTAEDGKKWCHKPESSPKP